MAKPFVKWAGGKTQLLEQLKARMPAEYNTYFEPMVGGGALFFAVQPEQAMIVDANEDLIRLYKVVQNNAEELIEDLQRHENTLEYYKDLRVEDRMPSYADWSDVQKASRTLFLNRTCFNGLFRVNKSGQFNVPFGKYRNPYIPTAEHLRACSAALQNCSIAHNSFTYIDGPAQEGDFVYFDPPYLPRSITSSFTQYTKWEFPFDSHVALRDFCRTLDERGVKFMLSNVHNAVALRLYEGWNIDVVSARRAIAAKAASREPVEEIIVRNYE